MSREVSLEMTDRTTPRQIAARAKGGGSQPDMSRLAKR